jgi:hypothetical protein
MRIFCDAETKHGKFLRRYLGVWVGNKQRGKYVCSSVVNRMQGKITALTTLEASDCFSRDTPYSMEQRYS